jgi:hypothetical protein
VTRLVPDAPHPVVRRGWRRGLPIGVLHLAAMAVVHATRLPDVDRAGEAGDRALERWMLACVLAGAGTGVVWLLACVRIEAGANRWVAPPRRSGWLPLPDPATGCLAVVLAVLAVSLATLVEVLAVIGPQDAFLLTAVTLLLQLVGTIAAVTLVLWPVMAGVGIAVGLGRRRPADGDGGPTGPLLVSAGVAAYAALALVACLPAWLVDLPVRSWMPVVPALVLVVALVTRIVLGHRARAAQSSAADWVSPTP